MVPERIDIDVSATCPCPKCRILRALAEPQTELRDAVEAMAQVIAILSAGPPPDMQSAVRGAFARAWLVQTLALAGAAPLAEGEPAPRAPTAH